MSDQKVPQAPDYSPMINAYNAIAQHATGMGQQAYDWAKGQVANNQGITDAVTKGDLDTSSTFNNAAKNSLGNSQANIDDATGYLRNERDRYLNPTYQQSDMGAAEATTGQAFDAARNSSIQELESFGVNPGATRFAGLDTGVRLQKAAAQAAAGTQAATTDRQMADQANAQLLGEGNTEAGQAATNAGVGTSAGGAGAATGLAQTASGANVLGTDLAWTGAGTNALSGAVNAQNTGFQNTATSDKLSNDSSSGIGSILGYISGNATKAAMTMAEGGAIPDAASGGMLPPAASPSGGAVTDDIPASAPGHPNIRLNGGEVIIPKDVAGWMGDKFFADLIGKARKAMPNGQQQQGRPNFGPAVGGAQSRPAVG